MPIGERAAIHGFWRCGNELCKDWWWKVIGIINLCLVMQSSQLD